jgi:hypothetical protein
VHGDTRLAEGRTGPRRRTMGSCKRRCTQRGRACRTARTRAGPASPAAASWSASSAPSPSHAPWSTAACARASATPCPPASYLVHPAACFASIAAETTPVPAQREHRTSTSFSMCGCSLAHDFRLRCREDDLIMCSIRWCSLRADSL